VCVCVCVREREREREREVTKAGLSLLTPTTPGPVITKFIDINTKHSHTHTSSIMENMILNKMILFLNNSET